jgi:4-nitrophenyl phosphatase
MGVYNKLTFLLDWDGTMFNGIQPVEGAKDFFDFLTDMNARIIYLTNNSSRSCEEYETILRESRLWNNNCHVITSGLVSGWYISEILNIKEVFIIGTLSLIMELKKFGIKNTFKEAKLILLGFDKTITYNKIQRGHELIKSGLPFYATHNDKVCPGHNKSYVDCGSFIQIFKASADSQPTIIGKPYKIMQEFLFRKISLNLEFTKLIGDRLETDGKMAEELGVRFYHVNQNNSSNSLKAIKKIISKE